MTDLKIAWPDGEARFSTDDSPIQIGRSSSAAVPLTEGSVSRRHLELTWDGSVWVATDSSTHGTFDPIGVRLANAWTVSDETTIRLGGVEGVRVHIEPEPATVGSAGLFPADNGTKPNSATKSTGLLFADQATPQQLGPPAEQPAPPSTAEAGAGPLGNILEDPSLVSLEEPEPARLDEPPASFDDERRSGVALEPERSPLGSGPTGGHPAISVDPNATIISDSTLRLNVAGQDYSFLPGAEVTVGRDPACLVQLDERHSLVSRQHLLITFDDGHWWLEDHSSKGTWVNHRRLKGPYKAEGAFVANLGDDDAGTPMRIITAGEHRVPRAKTPILIAALAAAALIPLAILAYILTRETETVAEPDFTAAKQSTVMLFGMEGGQGTGFFVDENLIVTNQHVAVLSPQLLVAVSREADEPAEIEYATELVANHPFLDIAVIRITNPVTMTGDGPQITADPVGDIGLPAVTIGDSNDISIGDPVFSTGFPGRLSITSANDAGELRLPPVVATSGFAANFTIWPGCSNPDFDTFIPADSPPGVACSAGGDINKGVLVSTFSSGQGASGSAVFRDNEVVAVVYAGAAEETNASLNITTAAFSGWLQEIIDNN